MKNYIEIEINNKFEKFELNVLKQKHMLKFLVDAIVNNPKLNEPQKKEKLRELKQFKENFKKLQSSNKESTIQSQPQIQQEINKKQIEKEKLPKEKKCSKCLITKSIKEFGLSWKVCNHCEYCYACCNTFHFWR